MSNKSAWQTPRADGQRLLIPNPSEWISIAQEHPTALRRSQYMVEGRLLSELATRARAELYKAALHYSRDYRDVQKIECSELANAVFLLAGHQPEIFHPGVWLKNALLDQVAKKNCFNEGSEEQVVPINLVVDTDLVKSNSLKIPAGSWDRPRWERIILDHGKSDIPWEERKVTDVDFLAAWPERMLQATLPTAQNGSWREYWPFLSARARTTGNLGLAISQARHIIEGSWGWNTLELPTSHLIRLPAIRSFLLHLLVSADRFREIYNRSINNYKKKYDITSHAHPAPLLEQRDGWCETPFWIWHVDNPSRSQLWAKQSDHELILSDRANWELKFPLAASGSLESASDAWTKFESQGYRIRTRALLTTLVARFLLSDLFVHGLGGAKYDEVTDHLINEFFGVDAPAYAVVSGTLLWPEAAKYQSAECEQTLVRNLRETQYHPERFVNGQTDDATRGLIAEKKKWIETSKTPQNARERHQSITRVNESLQSAIANRRKEIDSHLGAVRETSRARAIIGSRELPFVMHSATLLKQFFSCQLGKQVSVSQPVPAKKHDPLAECL